MKRFLITGVIVVVAALVVWQIVGRTGGVEEDPFEFVEIERGDLENIISATGTLSAVGTVDVGTQVSGTIDEVRVDYNESVKRGQVLAVLDTTLLVSSVRDAEANVLKSQAQYDQALRSNERMRELSAGRLVSDAEFEDSVTSLMEARGALLSAEASLDRAKTNLSHAVIRSPIDGTVIMRNVEAGQTVAASFSTPTLFVITEDMTDMEIHALVDESDIGQVREGQSVRFTVEAYIDEEFHGIVRQIWLQPETIQNVVNYTVVIDASNEDGLLYPGMTATVDFLIDERKDVLLVSNAAVKFHATPAMFAEIRESMEERANELPEEERLAMQQRMASSGAGGTGEGQIGGGQAGAASGFGAFGGSEENVARLWYLDDEGRLNVARVRTGATDGRMTEIVEGKGIHEGLEVITSVSETYGDERTSRNPLVTGPFGRRRH